MRLLWKSPQFERIGLKFGYWVLSAAKFLRHYEDIPNKILAKTGDFLGLTVFLAIEIVYSSFS